LRVGTRMAGAGGAPAGKFARGILRGKCSWCNRAGCGLCVGTRGYVWLAGQWRSAGVGSVTLKHFRTATVANPEAR
jgi:hypothetical protein